MPLEDYFSLESISTTELVIRMGLAAGFGFLLGFDRDSKNKPIDFRAYMIVCLTACMICIMAQELNVSLALKDAEIVLDLGKIVSGVMTGIGFLGAGAIIHKRGPSDEQVVGTATGATIWGAGGIGLCLGFGNYLLAAVTFVIFIAILIIGGAYRHHINGNGHTENNQ